MQVGPPGRWIAYATIPLAYLPPQVANSFLVNSVKRVMTSASQVTKCNADSSHGNETHRKYNSLYPVPSGSGITEPN